MRSTELHSGKIRPPGAVCSYSGYLMVSDLVHETAEQVRATARAVGLELDVGDRSIEFEYQGRDSNRFVIKFLLQIAPIIGTASGEIRCEVSSDEGDPCFEFYRISGGRLIRQFGTIVRQDTQELRLDNIE